MSARNRTRLVDAISPFYSARIVISVHRRCRYAGTRQLRSQGPGSTHVHRTEGVTGCEVGEETNGFRGGIRVGNRNGDRNGVGGRNEDVNVDGEGDGAGTTTGVEANQGTQDGN